MNRISLITAVGVLAASAFALPAFAASSTTTLAPGQVPACSSNTAQQDMRQGVYAQELQRAGQTIQSLEIWNGCVKVLYDDASGGSSMAIYDPDTLQLLQQSGPSGDLG